MACIAGLPRESVSRLKTSAAPDDRGRTRNMANCWNDFIVGGKIIRKSS